MLSPGLEHRDDLEKVPITNECFDRRGWNQDFAFRDPNVQFRPKAQALGNDSDQAIGELSGNIVLNLGRECADHPLQRFRTARGMDRRQNQVASFRGGGASGALSPDRASLPP